MQTAFDYYRASHPGWGTSAFQFRSPPQPAFQPLPTWSGWDYYRAHAVNPDQNLYYTVMNRTRDFGPNGGAGMREARHWQRRVYSGLVDLTQLLPADIGMAAAYEAYRMWKHHHSLLFDPLLSAGAPAAVEREREAIVGLAIGEATRLWQYTNRPMDTYGLRDCLESASMTAFRISYEVLGETAAAQPYAAAPVAADPYADPYGTSRRLRRHSNAAPVMFAGQASSQGPPSPYMGGGTAMPMSIPGRAGSTGSSMGMGGSPYLGGGSLYDPPSPIVGATPPYTTGGLGTSPYGSGMTAGMPAGGMGGMGGMTAGGMSGGYAGGMPGAPMSNASAMAANVASAYRGNDFNTGGLSRSYGGGVSPINYVASAGAAPVQYATAQPGTYSTYGPGGVQPGYGAGYGAGYAGSGGMPHQGVTIQHNGRLIPAQPGSTIVIKSRPRRRSHRSSSVDLGRY